MAEAWTKWESQVINEIFPLRRFLGGSDHSAVFLTEYKARQVPNAAIKLIPADPAVAETQLSRWKTAATLSHPHLLRLFDSGRCVLDGHPFLYVVTEYAEETLSQILPLRALTSEEVRQMLAPTLDALTFLHSRNFVQGQLKPPNFLVVNDQLKLATDSICPIGESRASISKPTIYDAPETKNGKASPASDVWSLGVTLVEALTQCLPAWPDGQSGSASLPKTLPASFTDITRRCLNPAPDGRPSVASLVAWIKNPSVTTAAPVKSPTPDVAMPLERPKPANKPEPVRQRNIVGTAIAAAIVVLAIWGGSRLFRGHSGDQPITSVTQVSPDQTKSAHGDSQTSAAPSSSAPSTRTEKPAATGVAPTPPEPSPSGNAAKNTPVDPSTQVLHEEVPDVPRSARNTIHGKIKISVRVTVDGAGNVTDESLENAGPSKYFARLATEAAQKWKFAPANNEDQDSRSWLLRFEFTRGGTSARATPTHS